MGTRYNRAACIVAERVGILVPGKAGKVASLPTVLGDTRATQHAGR